MANFIKSFNEHFVEFVEDIQSVFPDDVDIKTAKNFLILFKKSNPRLLVKIWKEHIVNKYQNEIK